MSEEFLEFVTYIKTSPEQLWQALTDPASTRQYWSVEFETDWAVGSPMVWLERGIPIAEPEQVVLESEYPRKLKYTWHTLTHGWAEGAGVTDDIRARGSAEPRSTATFEIEPMLGMVKLTVIHGPFQRDSVIQQMCRNGWPKILSGLKSLLETGEPLPDSQFLESADLTTRD